jgi:hypothetical protein
LANIVAKVFLRWRTKIPRALMRFTRSDARDHFHVGIEEAIRSWAAEDKDVASMVASVDGRRVAGIAKLLADAGVQGERALHRAAFLYWAYLGQAVVMDPRLKSISAVALDEICDLFERERSKTPLST